ncbi:hypothetical protein [Palaeococcus sp. (in: euryarchaeotes)]
MLELLEQLVAFETVNDPKFFTPYCVEAIDFGPKGGNIHGPNEYGIL